MAATALSASVTSAAQTMRYTTTQKMLAPRAMNTSESSAMAWTMLRKVLMMNTWRRRHRARRAASRPGPPPGVHHEHLPEHGPRHRRGLAGVHRSRGEHLLGRRVSHRLGGAGDAGAERRGRHGGAALSAVSGRAGGAAKRRSRPAGVR